jgi:mono/diheme cytochrome c family protein
LPPAYGLRDVAPAGSFDVAAAGRGKALFEGQARCIECHTGSSFTDAPKIRGSAALLAKVVDHCNDFLGLALSEDQQLDLEQYLLSL